MGVSTSSQAKKLSCSVQLVVSIDLSYSSHICICHSVQLVSLKVQRNLWHFKIWISKVPDFGCQRLTRSFLSVKFLPDTSGFLTKPGGPGVTSSTFKDGPVSSRNKRKELHIEIQIYNIIQI